MQADQGNVVVERREHDGAAVAWVLISNPKRLNAGSPGVIAALRQAFQELASERDLRAAVLTGEGDRAFMAGADLNALDELDPESARQFITSLHEACAAIRGLPVPVIGRMRGHCLGGGLEIAAACDFRVADPSFVMGMPEVHVGLPSVIEAALLPGLIGWGRTRELVLTGGTYGAEEALAMGMVERLVPADGLDDAVGHWLSQIVRSGPRAIRSQKALLAKWERLGLDAAIEAGIEHFSDAYRADEPRRLIAPLLKRKG